ncbi:MAG: hypothetical protein QG656_1058 [Candidatus Hydrogenedentes bacterium]|nr:hypothetical protein [Candidatus Hydrogenedentota bacterium]
MSDDEVFVFILSGVAGVVGAFLTRVSSLPSPYTRRNAGIGLMRLAVLAAIAWTWFVIQFFGDPSIQGVYVWFYLVMAYGVTKMFGQVGAQMYGVSLRSDAYERRNLAAALFIAAFTLATGIVFGGSIWGEADPLTDAEGGWWIPFGFFLMGWFTLVIATAVYLWREPGRFRTTVCQERDRTVAWSAAAYVVSSATLLLQGVAGDFWGWRHGMLGMGTIALMLIGHEVIMFLGGRGPEKGLLRAVERSLYLALAVIVWVLSGVIDRLYVGG